ncbi:MAG: HAD-IC family P-type ATPase, partial [Candidatus Zixiibacteriota bacterium]
QAIGEQPGVTSLANKISAYFTPSILGLALITGLFWLIIDSSRALNTATAVLIIACPCALALASPFTLGTAQRIMGRRDLYLKDDQVVEKMAGLTSIVFDKTGTITQSGASEPVFVGGELDSKVKSMIFSVVRESTHPLSMLLTNQLEGSVVVAIKNFDEFRGRGLEAEVNGHNLRIGSEEWVGAKKNDNLDMTTVFVAVDKEILGYFKIANLFRKGLPDLINKLKSDYKLALLSGDNDSERSRIETIFGKESELIFNQLPHDKLSYIHSKINSGEMTAMIGDGLNDAGALKAATVGFSIVENSSSFSPACDGILISSGFRLLSSFLRLAKDSIGIIKISFLISFLYNLIGLTFAVKGTLSPVIAAALMPASSVTVVIFTTLATTLAAKHRGII